MSNSYNAEDVDVLDDMSHIRIRPGMYVDSTDDPRQLLSEALDNALDEAQSGFSALTEVFVDTQTHEYSIRDYGRGIPIGMKELPDGLEKETLQVLATKSFSGGKFKGNNYKLRGGLHGVGLGCCNALSEKFEIATHRDNQAVYLYCERGEVQSLQYYDTAEPNGLTITIQADPEIYDTVVIPFDYIVNRCLVAKAFGYPVDLYVDGAMYSLPAESVADLIPKEDSSKYAEFEVSAKLDTGEFIKVIMRYTSETTTKYFGYSNLIYNRYGGTHTRLIDKAIEEVWKDYYGESEGVDLRDSDCKVGLRALCAVFISEVAFSSQTKDKLTVKNEVVQPLIDAFKDEFKKVLEDNPELRKALIKRFAEYRQSQNRLTARKEIMDLVKINGKTDSGTVRRKSVVNGLIECTSPYLENTQLYLVEGNSAGGTAARARDKKTQSVLPLRGKIKNITYMSINQALKSEDIRKVVNATGAGVGDETDPERCRYEKIIISCFTGDTKVKCLDGNSYSFEELVDTGTESLWVYSRDQSGSIVPALATNPRVTREVTEILELTLDNGETIRCTPDHRFLIDDGSYKRADELEYTDSLSPLYLRVNDSGYIQYFDETSGQYENVHTMVNNFCNSEFKQSLDYSKYFGKWRIPVTHHKNFRRTDNTPSNLCWMLWGDHLKYHDQHWESTLGEYVRSEEARRLDAEIITEYNQSPERIAKLIEAHKNGVYEHTYWSNNGYNGSDAHIAAVKAAWNDPNKRVAMTQSLVDFNKSENHRNQVRAMNSDEDMIYLQQRGKLCKKGKKILDSGIELNEESIRIERIRLSTIMKYFNSFEEYVECSKNYNHKIVSRKVTKLDTPMKVYCMTVEDYGNFALDSGVFVHNCDADPDGKHITALLISVYVNLMPALVKAGRVYVLEPPLFGYVQDKHYIFTNEFEEIPEKLRTTKGYTRYKGLGEMDDDEFKESCMTSGNQNLYQVQYPEDLDAFNRILGTTGGRRELLVELGIIRYMNGPANESNDEMEGEL